MRRVYDDAGRITLVTDWLGFSTGYAYDRDGNQIEQWTSPASVDTG